ncbi:hypothetical protein B0J12DRAFT_752472 [Macrophomina phaseolina]|uniref:Uncharacterized protein n=1 Tax=Macrophomina phaseolina TaxID=35725 RepID=A0ABQ8GBF8_9PEZI|nr:hypothetical protein B0J12DRAFT_752472 [Macrophomina phaseolina]
MATRACGRDSSLPGRRVNFFLITALLRRQQKQPSARVCWGLGEGRGERARPRQRRRPEHAGEGVRHPALSSSIQGRVQPGGRVRPWNNREDVNLPKSECDACAAGLRASARRPQSAPNRQRVRAGRRPQRVLICWEKAWGPDSLAIGHGRTLTCRRPPGRVGSGRPGTGIALPARHHRPARRAWSARKKLLGTWSCCDPAARVRSATGGCTHNARARAPPAISALCLLHLRACCSARCRSLAV